ncbi:MAG: hypothetical protein Q7T05_00105 [Dehalococcoidia bacterium]|nr:hypothetical protein [Dehalococcoidia bacterium]
MGLGLAVVVGLAEAVVVGMDVGLLVGEGAGVVVGFVMVGAVVPVDGVDMALLRHPSVRRMASRQKAIRQVQSFMLLPPGS